MASDEDAISSQAEPCTSPFQPWKTPTAGPSDARSQARLFGFVTLPIGGDCWNRSKPHTGGAKLNRNVSLLSQAPQLPRTRGVVTLTVSHAVREPADEPKLAGLVRQLSESLGCAAGEDTFRWCSPTMEVAISIAPMNSLVGGASANHLHVVVASSGSVVRNVMKAFNTDAAAPAAVVVVSPLGGNATSRVVHVLRRGSISVSPLTNGVPVSLAALPFYLRAACQSVRGSLGTGQARGRAIEACFESGDEAAAIDEVYGELLNP